MSVEKESVRDFVDAADVKEEFLYRKDGYICMYLRIYPFNLNLKSKQERKEITKNLVAEFQADRKDFVYFTLPREIDLDKYKNNLKARHQDEVNIGKRHILADMMVESAMLSTSGENFEHQHFMKIWKKGKDRKNVENDLRDRIKDFQTWYRNVGIETAVVSNSEIVKLCNLFGNSLQASFENVESNTRYTPITQIM